jgi:hypothetical protein
MAEYGYNPLRNLHPGDPAERWIPVSAGNNVTFGVSFYAQRTSMIGHAIVQFVPNPSPPPPVPDIDPPSYFAGELDPSLVLSPLTVGADFELNVPGIDPIEYHASLPIGQDQLPVDIDPMQFGFATNEFVANLLRKFTPFSETVEVTGTVRLSGDAQLGGKLYLTEGSKTARLEAGIGAGVNLTVKARLQGSFCDVPLLGKMLCREVSATFPISGLTYGYSKDIPLPVIYDDESKEIDLAGMGISASLYAESSATLGAQVSLREVMPNAYPGMIFDMDIIESLDDPLNWTIEDYLNSETGTVEIPGPGNVTMETDSPVWIATMYEVTRSSDVIVFEAEFLSDLGAEGFLSVYWDDQLIGSLAEQDATARKQIYLFALPGVYDGGSYPLAFRLDPLSDIDSKVSISDVAAGFAAVPEPTTSFLLALGGLAMLRRRRRRGWL